MRAPRFPRALLLAAALALGVAVAGPASAGPFAAGTLTPVSGPSPFASCDVSAIAAGGTLYPDAEVEPWVAVNPTDPSNIVAVWQQDRWSNGGARGLVTGVSHDGGATWTRTFAHFSTCSGGTAANGGNYERASDPWVTFAPNGDAYQISLSVNFVNDPASAILVSKSTDKGDHWSEPVTLNRDGPTDKFNDKETITADPTNSNYIYAVWDRSRFPSDKFVPGSNVSASIRGDILFARTTNAGATWEAAKTIFRPLDNEATISNQITVLADGTLVDMFQLLKGSGANKTGYDMAFMRSTDKGATWTGPFEALPQRFQGALDPDTGRRIRAEGAVFDIAADRTGNLYAAWQDSRFRGVDEIAFSQSSDGGDSWSAPVRVSQTPASSSNPLDQQAFVPQIDVAADGTIAVSYYDFRANTADPGAPTDFWIVHCHASCTNPPSWGGEARLTNTSFDIEQAPAARGPFGFFLGEYEGFDHIGTSASFANVFAEVNDGTAANRTDIVYRSAG
jgi:hypothetical protein